MNAGELRGLTREFGPGTDVVFATDDGSSILVYQGYRIVRPTCTGEDGREHFQGPPTLLILLEPRALVEAGKPEEDPVNVAPGPGLNGHNPELSPEGAGPPTKRAGGRIKGSGI